MSNDCSFDDFTLVIPKHKRKSRHRKCMARGVSSSGCGAIKTCDCSRIVQDNDPQRLEKPELWAASGGRLEIVTHQVFEFGRGLELFEDLKSKLFESLSHLNLLPFHSCISLGVGRLSTRNSELQIALIKMLSQDGRLIAKNDCKGESTMTVFEPAFDDGDHIAMKAAGFISMTDNKSGKVHSVDGRSVLFYMPHCHSELYNNVLWANWNPNALSRIVFLGNDMRKYGESEIFFSSSGDPPECLLRLLEYMEVRLLSRVDRNSDLERAFNNTCVQWFPKAQLNEAQAAGVFDSHRPPPCVF